MNHIETNPGIMLGKPVIRGTRITVEHVLELIEAGKDVDYIAAEYSGLNKEAVVSAIRYARESVATERAYPLAIAVK
jgi:uncharacterized protein (DUF433 family)